MILYADFATLIFSIFTKYDTVPKIIEKDCELCRKVVNTNSYC